MALLAALDLGTNSFHLVVARVTEAGIIEVVTRHKESVRLGHGGGDMKLIEPAAMDRGIAALGRARRIADGSGATIRAVATSAVREAENAGVFIERARVEAGVEIEVISGIEEARLIHLGAIRAVPVADRRLLLADIGGGSTEVVVGEGEDVLAARSFKLGAVRLTDRFFARGEVSPSAIERCRAHIRSTLAGFEREVGRLGFELAIGCSGTIEAVARLAQVARDANATEPRTFNGFTFDRTHLTEVVTALTAARTAEARRKVPGLDPDRADIIVAGVLVLEGLFDAFAVPAITISEYALREGVLLDTYRRLDPADGDPAGHPLGPVSLRAIVRLVELGDDDPRHSAHVADLAVSLFDQTVSLHRLDRASRDYLEAAARLANVGLVIAHSRHHLHSYYVIRNSELLIGFTDREIELIALVARYHRKSAPKPSHPEFARLAPRDQQRVRILAGLLRVAIGLDRSHSGVVRSVDVVDSDGSLELRLGTDPGADVDLERYAATERRGLLELALDRTITIT